MQHRLEFLKDPAKRQTKEILEPLWGLFSEAADIGRDEYYSFKRGTADP